MKTPFALKCKSTANQFLPNFHLIHTFIFRVASEIGRRQVLLDNLKKLVANGTIKENIAPSSANVRTGGARLSMDSSKNATQNPLTSDQALLQRQRDIMKMQDDMLLDIEVGVGRLHEKVRFFFFRFSSSTILIVLHHLGPCYW